jgi:hypothetical protein
MALCTCMSAMRTLRSSAGVKPCSLTEAAPAMSFSLVFSCTLGWYLPTFTAKSLGSPSSPCPRDEEDKIRCPTVCGGAKHGWRQGVRGSRSERFLCRTPGPRAPPSARPAPLPSSPWPPSTDHTTTGTRHDASERLGIRWRIPPLAEQNTVQLGSAGRTVGGLLPSKLSRR